MVVSLHGSLVLSGVVVSRSWILSWSWRLVAGELSFWEVGRGEEERFLTGRCCTSCRSCRLSELRRLADDRAEPLEHPRLNPKQRLEARASQEYGLSLDFHLPEFHQLFCPKQFMSNWLKHLKSHLLVVTHHPCPHLPVCSLQPSQRLFLLLPVKRPTLKFGFRQLPLPYLLRPHLTKQ